MKPKQMPTLISVCSPELRASLEAYAQEHNLTTYYVVRLALAKFLDFHGVIHYAASKSQTDEVVE